MINVLLSHSSAAGHLLIWRMQFKNPYKNILVFTIILHFIISFLFFVSHLRLLLMMENNSKININKPLAGLLFY